MLLSDKFQWIINHYTLHILLCNIWQHNIHVHSSYKQTFYAVRVSLFYFDYASKLKSFSACIYRYLIGTFVPPYTSGLYDKLRSSLWGHLGKSYLPSCSLYEKENRLSLISDYGHIKQAKVRLEEMKTASDLMWLIRCYFLKCWAVFVPWKQKIFKTITTACNRSLQCHKLLCYQSHIKFHWLQRTKTHLDQFTVYYSCCATTAGILLWNVMFSSGLRVCLIVCVSGLFL